MTTNQMRREAAKRKLERQQDRRAQQAVRRKKAAVITSAAVVVLVVLAVVLLTVFTGGDEPATDPNAAAPVEPAATPVLGQCAFTPTPNEPAAKPAEVPGITEAPTAGAVPITMQTNRGTIPLTLDRSKAPCTVESFVRLTQAGYFNATPCHRLTATDGLKVLQCGDPTGTGSGGPGYRINDEQPTDLAPSPTSPDVVIYPRGTLAMAKTREPNSGGSQFFLVYADSALPPQYTVFGTIGEGGLAVLDQIAADGLANASPSGDGAPAQPVIIDSAALA